MDASASRSRLHARKGQVFGGQPAEARGVFRRAHRPRRREASDRVTRVDYRARPGTEIEVDLEYDSPTFPVVDARVPATTPRILMYGHHDYAWTCSNADSLMIQLDQSVAAVRAAWTRGEVTETHLVVPQIADGKVVVELGKLNCGGANIDPDELRLGGHLALVAIRLDGSEVALTGLPDPISTDDLATDADGASFAMTVLPPIEPEAEAAPPAPPASSSGPLAGAIVLAIGALALAIGVRNGMRPL